MDRRNLAQCRWYNFFQKCCNVGAITTGRKDTTRSSQVWDTAIRKQGRPQSVEPMHEELDDRCAFSGLDFRKTANQRFRGNL